ncbi:lactonase family protein [Vagococcus xieshaowenii]|uniref:Lactonase family protein n=1 Tax=Vagococcus xieshaowenii TaxID=2562451 RepID=A0AAJ5JKT2_9ENTE|nr:lactonase family protein [Vagococcus xieshaowenii]QCA28127.1 lactonase family protein [Vagococcus xieshaowenii]TFZ40171.1 lactonase family protein [Vagococcus xieshaowenii]
METILLGTYTKKTSQGIYQLSLDTENKTLENLKLIAVADSPTYLGTSKQNFLYVVSKDEAFGGVAVYELVDGEYVLRQQLLEEGAPPCYIGVDNVRGFVFDANYHRGLIHVYKILEDGTLELRDTAIHTGNGPHANQTAPHAHYADLTPDNRLVSCDLGTDDVHVYDINDEGKLTEASVFRTTPGAGPRHIVFHPTLDLAYIIGELNNTITVVDYQRTDGSMTELQTISTLPENNTTQSSGGAIRISSDGRFLYASNRGHDSLAIFSVSDNGETLALIDIVSSEGDFPRDFTLNKTEDFLICSHQESDNLALFERSKETGKLSLISRDTLAPECVCTYIN